MIITLDCGTTSNRCLAIDAEGQILAESQQEFSQFFPRPAWVEHDAAEIWRSTHQVLQEVLQQVPISDQTVIAITNQRETVVAWDKQTSQPLCPAIVWQCRRTADRINDLSDHQKHIITFKTGLPADAYFSATKIEWMVKHVDSVKQAISEDRCCFGTIDSWILWNLTKGRVHATDTSNASRTMVMNCHTLSYDGELCDYFGINPQWLPVIQDSNSVFGETDASITGQSILIQAILGDQQASLFAQCGSDSTMIKNTYGTGLFVCACTGSRFIQTPSLISTVAWSINGMTDYAIEGSVFVGGSAIQWLRDELEIITHAADTSQIAQSISSSDAVFFVPALTGLGAPHWDSSARGVLIGLTRGTSRAHIVRATLESMAYQTKDVLEALREVLPYFKVLKVDGGASNNDFLMQFQADICHMIVEKPIIVETTAYGVAGLAGITKGIFSEKEFRSFLCTEKTYHPQFDSDTFLSSYQQWQKAVARSKQWV